MNKGFKYAVIFIAFAFAWAGPAAFAAAASAGSAKSTAKTTTSTSMMSDSAFAKAAAEGGFAEVKLGDLAEQKGSSQEVKDFGKRMVADHSKADNNLKSAASKVNPPLSLPTQMSAKDQATYDSLSKLSGSAFDRAYAQDMVRDHVGDIAAFQHEANDGKDASIKEFASKTLPTLEGHLKSAREMEHSVTAKSSSSMKKEKS